VGHVICLFVLQTRAIQKREKNDKQRERERERGREREEERERERKSDVDQQMFHLLLPQNELFKCCVCVSVSVLFLFQCFMHN